MRAWYFGVTLAILAIVSVAVFLPAHAEVKTYSNLGFLAGNIWYSKDPFFAGDKVRIYSGVYNSGVHDLVGSVEFSDNGTLLASVPFLVQGQGRMKDVWVDWTTTKGDHKISARIVNAKLAVIGGKEEPIAIASAQSGESERFADTDTDKDGIGDREDTDDDNDTLSDVEEIKQGTNQYQKDSDKDGITDDKEVAMPIVETKNTTSTATTSTSAITESPIVRAALAAVAIAQDAVDHAAGVASKKVDALQKDVAASLEDTGSMTPGDVVPKPDLIFRKPFEYGYFLALSLASFILNNKIALYSVLALVGLVLLRGIFRRLFSR